MKELDYLGHHLSNCGILISLDVLEKIRSYQIPRNLAEVKQFLCLIEQYNSYLDDYAKLIQPLERLIKSKIGFYWNRDEQIAFDSLKRGMVEASALPFKERYYYYDTVQLMSVKSDETSSVV